jgi:hypothetical protein
LQKGNEIYGAIISGEHLFYITEKGKSEYLDGQALFTDLWLLKNDQWKMARILSYNHHAPDYINKRKEIKLSENKLDQLTGTYKGTQTGAMSVERENDWLILHAGNNTFKLYPESETIFFTKERDLTF